MKHNKTKTTALAELTNMDTPLVPRQSSSASALMMNDASMDKMIRVAELMACGRSTIPKHLQGSVGDCMAVVMQAVQWNMNPFAVAQKTHVVNGALGYEAQLVAAVINNSGVVMDRFHYEWAGKWEGINGKTDKSASISVKIWATLKGETDPRELTVTMAEAGVRNSPLWEHSPKIQLSYLAAKRWARLYAPDVILGVYTPDEFDAPPPRNMGQAQVVHQEVSPELLGAAQAAAEKGVAGYQAFWQATGPGNRKMLAGEHDRLKTQAVNADKARTVDTPAATPAATPQTDAPVVTYAKVMDMLLAAKNSDALDVAADWVGEVADPEQRAELLQKYEALRAAMVPA